MPIEQQLKKLRHCQEWLTWILQRSYCCYTWKEEKSEPRKFIESIRGCLLSNYNNDSPTRVKALIPDKGLPISVQYVSVRYSLSIREI